jgi:hypothetical protein
MCRAISDVRQRTICCDMAGMQAMRRGLFIACGDLLGAHTMVVQLGLYTCSCLHFAVVMLLLTSLNGAANLSLILCNISFFCLFPGEREFVAGNAIPRIVAHRCVIDVSG